MLFKNGECLRGDQYEIFYNSLYHFMFDDSAQALSTFRFKYNYLMQRHLEIEKLLKEFNNSNVEGGYTGIKKDLKGMKSNLETEKREIRLICSQQEVNQLKEFIRRLC